MVDGVLLRPLPYADPERIPGVPAILRDPATGVLRAGADPRREAYSIAY